MTVWNLAGCSKFLRCPDFCRSSLLEFLHLFHCAATSADVFVRLASHGASLYCHSASHVFRSTRTLTAYTYRFFFRDAAADWTLRPGGARPVHAGSVVVAVPPTAEVPFADLNLGPYALPTTFSAYLRAPSPSKGVEQSGAPFLSGT